MKEHEQEQNRAQSGVRLIGLSVHPKRRRSRRKGRGHQSSRHRGPHPPTQLLCSAQLLLSVCDDDDVEQNDDLERVRQRRKRIVRSSLAFSSPVIIIIIIIIIITPRRSGGRWQAKTQFVLSQHRVHVATTVIFIFFIIAV